MSCPLFLPKPSAKALAGANAIAVVAFSRRQLTCSGSRHGLGVALRSSLARSASHALGSAQLCLLWHSNFMGAESEGPVLGWKGKVQEAYQKPGTGLRPLQATRPPGAADAARGREHWNPPLSSSPASPPAVVLLCSALAVGHAESLARGLPLRPLLCKLQPHVQALGPETVIDHLAHHGEPAVAWAVLCWSREALGYSPAEAVLEALALAFASAAMQESSSSSGTRGKRSNPASLTSAMLHVHSTALALGVVPRGRVYEAMLMALLQQSRGEERRALQHQHKRRQQQQQKHLRALDSAWALCSEAHRLLGLGSISGAVLGELFEQLVRAEGTVQKLERAPRLLQAMRQAGMSLPPAAKSR